MPNVMMGSPSQTAQMLRFLNSCPSMVTISAIFLLLSRPGDSVPRRYPGQGATIGSMDDAAGTAPPRDEPGPDGPAERTSGIILETCYRHPRETTGVHCTRCGRPICPECMRPAAVGYQ